MQDIRNHLTAMKVKYNADGTRTVLDSETITSLHVCGGVCACACGVQTVTIICLSDQQFAHTHTFLHTYAHAHVCVCASAFLVSVCFLGVAVAIGIGLSFAAVQEDAPLSDGSMCVRVLQRTVIHLNKEIKK